MEYSKQIDGIRFFAVLFVLIEHFALPIGYHISAGFYGVDLFFTLSGFLITSILLNSKDTFFEAYKKFIGRRTLRIFPIYYLTIFVLFIFGYKQIHQYLFYCLTYSYNYAAIEYNIPRNALNHFWSLCVEEQFYIFWPFIVLKFKNKYTFLKYLIWILIILCSIQIYFNVIPSIVKHNGSLLFPRANSLVIGSLGAVLIKENLFPIILLKNKWIENILICTLIILLLSKSLFMTIFCPFISLIFIIKAKQNNFSFLLINKLLTNSFIVYLGSISYGIYMYHLPLEYYLNEMIFNPYWDKINFNSLGVFSIIEKNSWILKFPIYSSISIIFAHYSYLYIEKPILLLKDKFFKIN